MAGIRSFLAIPLPPELQQQLGRLQQELKRELPELRTPAPGSLHLSLQFLGDQPLDRLEIIGDLMQGVGAIIPAFSISLKGLGSFPGGKYPRVLWLGVEAAEPLLVLQAALVDGLCELGLPRDQHPYRPHLTLGRLRRPPKDYNLPLHLQNCDFGRMPVASIILFSSRLTPQGAVHKALRQVDLVDPAASID